jgi:hypothetical protein
MLAVARRPKDPGAQAHPKCPFASGQRVPCGVPLVAYAIAEKLVTHRLVVGDHALFVHLNTAAGGHDAKKSLWTFFGSVPLYVMGEAIVSYLEVKAKSGDLVRTGQFALHSGY